MIGTTIWTAYHAIGFVAELLKGSGIFASIWQHKQAIALWFFGFILLHMGMLMTFAAMNFLFLSMIVLAIWITENSGDIEKTKLLAGALKLHGIVSIASLALS